MRRAVLVFGVGPALGCRLGSGELGAASSSCALSLVVLVAACTPRTQGAEAIATAPPTASGSASTPIEPAVASPVDEAPDEDDAALCSIAFADQRQLYVDAEVEVHPDHEAMFLEHCRQLPRSLQRCASPLHQLDHQSECDEARDEADRASMEAWHRMFDTLSGPTERLISPVPSEATQ